jgi:hypothetical protein
VQRSTAFAARSIDVSKARAARRADKESRAGLKKRKSYRDDFARQKAVRTIIAEATLRYRHHNTRLGNADQFSILKVNSLFVGVVQHKDYRNDVPSSRSRRYLERRAVMKLLEDAEWSQWSNGEIAKRANVSDKKQSPSLGLRSRRMSLRKSGVRLTRPLKKPPPSAPSPPSTPMGRAVIPKLNLQLRVAL